MYACLFEDPDLSVGVNLSALSFSALLEALSLLTGSSTYLKADEQVIRYHSSRAEPLGFDVSSAERDHLKLVCLRQGSLVKSYKPDPAPGSIRGTVRNRVQKRALRHHNHQS